MRVEHDSDEDFSKNEDNSLELKPFERVLFGVPLKRVHVLIPGILVISLLTFFSVWFSDFIGINLLGYEKSPISSVMIALLFGMIIKNVIKLPEYLNPGFKFAVKKILRLAIIFLGIRLSIFSVLELGALGIPIVLGCILSAILITRYFNKILHQPERLGTLIAVGTSICGVSAIIATSPTIDASEEETAYAVSVITVFGLLATLTYPFLAYFIFEGDPVQAGLWLGTAIHDTSQVTGAALVYSDIWGLPLGLDVATVTKLVRNLFMVMVIPLLSFYYKKVYENGNAELLSNKKKVGGKLNFLKLFPTFVIGFLIMAIIRSIGDAGINSINLAFGFITSTSWNLFINTIKELAAILFVVSLAGVGLTTDFQKFKGLGVKPFLVGLSAALTVGVISFLLISLIGSFIVIA